MKDCNCEEIFKSLHPMQNVFGWTTCPCCGFLRQPKTDEEILKVKP